MQRIRSLSNPDAREALLQGPRTERDAAQKALDAVRAEVRPSNEGRLKARALDETKAAAEVDSQDGTLDAKGRFQWGPQYSYVSRNTWSGVNATGGGVGPHGIDNMVFTSFRYYLP